MMTFEILQEIFCNCHYVSSTNFAYALSEFKRISSLLDPPSLETSGNLNFSGVFEGYRSEIIHLNSLEFQENFGNDPYI